MKETKQYLISCYYEYFCQGWEETFGYFLVNADCWENACEKLNKKLRNPRDFVNCNIE